MAIGLRLKTDSSKDDRKIKVKKPSEVYDKCPHCRSVNILKLDEEVLCNSCGWNSVAIHVECLLRAEEQNQRRIADKKKARSRSSKTQEKVDPNNDRKAA